MSTNFSLIKIKKSVSSLNTYFEKVLRFFTLKRADFFSLQNESKKCNAKIGQHAYITLKAERDKFRERLAQSAVQYCQTILSAMSG